MKKLLLSIASLFILSTISQAQIACPWAKKAGGAYEDAGMAVTTDAQGNVYSVGYFYSPTLTIGTTTLQNTYGGSCMYLTKQDSCGNFIWIKKANGKNGSDVNPTGIATDASGNIYVSGYFTTDTVFFGALTLANASYHNAFLVQYNSSGVAQWAVQGTGNAQNEAYGVSVSGNNIYLAGIFASTTINFGSNNAPNYTNDGYTMDAFIAKFDNMGNSQWVKANLSNGNTSGHVIVTGVSTDANGNAYMSGYFESNYIRFNNDSIANNGFYDLFLVKYDANGNYQWVKTAGDSDDDRAFAVATDASGNTYLTGMIGYNATVNFGSHSVTNTNSSLQAFIAKYDANGNDLWANATKGNYYSANYGTGIALDANSNAYIIGGYSSDVFYIGSDTLTNYSTAGGGGNSLRDVFVAKYNASGMFSWSRTAGGDSNDIGYGIATGIYKNLYITGKYYSPSISFAGITLNSTNNIYGDAFIANNISTWTVTPQICLVSADSIDANNKQYNVIYWDKTPYTTVQSFIIYRETSTNVYTKIATVPYSALSEYVDTARNTTGANGDPTVGTYRYAIQLADTNETYSYMSPYHNTIYFQNNSGTFNWNVYAVGTIAGTSTTTPVTNFYLMRDDNNTGNYQVIGTVTGSQTSLTDPNYSTYAATANWRVDADGFNCTPTYRLANNHNNSTYAARVKSHSNSTNNRQVGIEKYSVNNQFVIYPNPTNSILSIALNNQQTVSVQIFDVLGNEVLKSAASNIKQTTIDVSGLNSGVYFIKVGNSTQKFIKE